MNFVIAFSLLCLVAIASAVSPDGWRGRSIYQVLTDRFARTDNSTIAPCDVSLNEYCGGTWKGIEYQLDYIYDMGFTAIWISPITKNTPEGYHGYYQTDLYSLNENFGTAQDLKDLSNALHARGMYLMVDVVTNHFGSYTNQPDIPWSSYNPFNSEDYFHPYCDIDYDNQTSADNAGSTTTFPTYAQKIKTIDGLRIDSVKDVDMASMPPFCEAAGVYCMGELSNNDPSYAYPYQAVLNGGGIINYPMYPAFNKTFVYPGCATMADLAYNIYVCKINYTDSTLQGTFTENHDNPRIAWHNRDLSLADNAIVWTILTDGIPIIYQGQEQHLAGADDPYCREAMWLEENGSYSTSAPLHGTVAYVNRIFHWASDNSPTYTTYQNSVQTYSDTEIQIRKDVVRTILTNTGLSQRNATFTTQQACFAAGQTVYEMLSCTAYTATEEGEVVVEVGGGAPKVLISQALIKGSTMCGQ